MGKTTAYLVVLAEREAILWVLQNELMAFPARPRREVSALQPGDELVLLTTRGAYHNPTRDRTRVIGTAIVHSKVAPFEPEVEIVGRTFASGCQIRLETLAPYSAGPEIGPLAPQIQALHGEKNWGWLLRKPLVLLDESDVALLKHELQSHLRELNESLLTYRNSIKAPT
ncbi:hypothetical protein [Pseudarthrobacter sp. NCCP-2145]|uniref:hypothetical protein n=1 Tax=Pseudarthrobacter sp. NCCP-2145 TaxID=2942290 RepID=UPI00203E4173|nr:hypothetical protein [Pseudarthrobacter sp. NCCP-2145]GKV72018.1 hypothetical protein NCCP2145_13990 [Pseudarthrobacter sp. NCCP-2145]